MCAYVCPHTCVHALATPSLNSVAITSSTIKNYCSPLEAEMDRIIPGFSDLDEHEENFSWTVQKCWDNINHAETGCAFYLKHEVAQSHTTKWDDKTNQLKRKKLTNVHSTHH